MSLRCIFCRAQGHFSFCSEVRCEDEAAVRVDAAEVVDEEAGDGARDERGDQRALTDAFNGPELCERE